MKKVLLIIQREYITRVKKKSFLILTILAPLLISLAIAAPVWLSLRHKTESKVLIIDNSNLFINRFQNTEKIKFSYYSKPLEEAKLELLANKYDLLVEIHYNILNATLPTPFLYFIKQPSFFTEQYISNSVQNILFDYRLQAEKIDVDKISNARKPVKLVLKKILENGTEKQTNTELNIFIGMFCSYIIYIMIIMYSMMVMKGVVEEKTSRVVEIIISSVKPFQLMLAKIIGVSLVGLTQVCIWISLTFILNFLITQTLFKKEINDTLKLNKQTELVSQNDILAHPDKMEKIDTPREAINWINYLQNINLPIIIVAFIFYFIGGYFVYAALFAAVGAAVDNETDTQQFMVPLTLPLLFTIIVSQLIGTDPNSGLAQFLSIFPLTSPLGMMIRIPFGVPIWQLLLSMGLLIVGFFVITKLASKIYKVGLVMYGKKISWKELLKWFFLKN